MTDRPIPPTPTPPPTVHAVEVLAPGQRVSLGDTCTKGTITGVLIRTTNYIQYQVTWWDGYTRREEWINHYLVVVHGGGTEKLSVGFVNSEIGDLNDHQDR